MAETTNLKDKESRIFRNLNKFINSSMISIQNSVIGWTTLKVKLQNNLQEYFGQK